MQMFTVPLSRVNSYALGERVCLFIHYLLRLEERNDGRLAGTAPSGGGYFQLKCGELLARNHQ